MVWGYSTVLLGSIVQVQQLPGGGALPVRYGTAVLATIILMQGYVATYYPYLDEVV